MELYHTLIPMAIICMCDCEKMCSSKSNIPQLISSALLSDYTFETKDGIGLLQCVDECYRRRRCKSINYNDKNNNCQLNHKGSTILDEDEDFVYSDIADWTGKLSGVCSNHSCPTNSVCKDVSGEAMCDVIYCDISSANKSVQVDLDTKYDGLFSEGQKVNYRCPTGYYRKDLVCGEGGVWTGEARCISPPVGCAGVLNCNSSVESGLYWIVHEVSNGTAVKVFCERRDDWIYPFLDLNEEYNFSVFPNQSCTDPLDYCGKTSFQKVRFSFGQFRLGDKDKHDHAEYNCGEEYAPFGWAGSCDGNTCRENVGKFLINTTGTGIIIDPSLEWTNSVVTRENDNRVVIGQCNAACQLCQPDVKDRHNRIPFVFDPYYQPPESEATVLNCPETTNA